MLASNTAFHLRLLSLNGSADVEQGLAAVKAQRASNPAPEPNQITSVAVLRSSEALYHTDISSAARRWLWIAAAFPRFDAGDEGYRPQQTC